MSGIRYSDVGLCNCAACGREVVGDRTARAQRSSGRPWPKGWPPAIGGRVGGRPLCAECLKAVRASGRK